MKNRKSIAEELLSSANVLPIFEREYLMVQLQERVTKFSSQMPINSFNATYSETCCVFQQAKEFAELSRVLSEKYGIPIFKKNFQAFDFTFQSYDEFHKEAFEFRKKLDKTPKNKLPQTIKNEIESEDFISSDLKSGSGKPSETISGYLLSKLLGALGGGIILADRVIDLIIGSPEFEYLKSAWKLKDWALVRHQLKRLLEYIFGKAFWKQIVVELGEDGALKLMKRFGARFIPFIGWALIIGSFVWSLAQEWGEKES
jgi:hypothetical protein